MSQNIKSLTFNEQADYIRSLGLDPFPYDSVNKKPNNILNDKYKFMEDNAERIKDFLLSDEEFKDLKKHNLTHSDKELEYFKEKVKNLNLSLSNEELKNIINWLCSDKQ